MYSLDFIAFMILLPGMKTINNDHINKNYNKCTQRELVATKDSFLGEVMIEITITFLKVADPSLISDS